MVGSVVTTSPDSESCFATTLRGPLPSSPHRRTQTDLDIGQERVSDAKELVRRLCRVHIHVEPLAQIRKARFEFTEEYTVHVVSSIHPIALQGDELPVMQWLVGKPADS